MASRYPLVIIDSNDGVGRRGAAYHAPQRVAGVGAEALALVADAEAPPGPLTATGVEGPHELRIPSAEMSQQMLRNRWDEAREKAAIKAGANGDSALAKLIR